MSTIEQLKTKIENIIGEDFAITTRLPDNQTAWFAIPIFNAAGKSGKDLAALAKEITKKLSPIQEINLETVGGYINIAPSQKLMIASLKEGLSKDFGSADIGKKQTVVIEFSGTNIAKPMSIGHLRSTIIGDSLQRIYRKLNFDVVSVNHLGDWGTQFGKLLVAYEKKYGDLKPRLKLTIKDLLDLYVNYHIQSERDPDLDDQARAMFKKLEDKDVIVRKLWQHFVDISLEEFETIFKRLGIKMDEPRMGESSYEGMLDKIVEIARNKGLSEESQGALIVRFKDESAPLILRKKDGATVYATRDLAQVKYRVDRYRPKKIIYVVANEQALHFRQYFQVARMMGIAPKSLELIHVKFGLVRLSTGKMSTRQGKVIFLDEVLNRAVRKAKLLTQKKHSGLPTAELEKISEVVGIGAIKYFDLSHDRNHDIVFNWQQMLSLSDNSAPYLQYSYTRAAGIIRRSKQSLSIIDKSLDQYQEKIELDIRKIIRQIAGFPLIIQGAAENNSPHIIANYLNQLAAQFHHFYEKYPVIKASGQDRILRLAIVAAVANVIKTGLELLGIGTLERM